MGIPLSVRPHTPFRGIDENWWIQCPRGGLTRVEITRDFWACGACGYRLEERA